MDATAFAGTFFTLFALAAGFVLLNGLRRMQTADRALADFADEHGWSYRLNAPELARRWSGPPFDEHSGTAHHAIAGLFEGLPFTAFSFRYTVNSQRNRVTVHYLPVVIPLPSRLPLLWILPQTPENTLTNPLGSHDITFESEQFNDAFLVSADSDRYASAVVHPRMMEFLLTSRARNVPIRIEGDHAIAWVRSDIDAATMMDVLSVLAAFVKQIPDFVYEQFAVPAPTAGYAGSVSGLRPEATRIDLVKTLLALVWGAVWLGVSVPLTWMNYGPRSVGPDNSTGAMISTILPAAFVLVGLVVVGSAVVKLIRGVAAIGLNRRGRHRLSA